MKTSPLTTKYGSEKRWVSWKIEKNDKGKDTKVPYIWSGARKASSTDPKDWNTFDKIKGEKTGIILYDKRLICIDMDHVLVDGKPVKEQQERIAEVVLGANSFAEVSQSGTGIHVFFEVEEPLDIVTNKSKKEGGVQYEVYGNARFIATTGISYGEEQEIATLTKEEALRIINIVVPQQEQTIEVSHENDIQDSLTDEEIINIVNKKKKAVYNGDDTEFQGDTSSGDMSLMTTLAFWTAKNYKQMERIFRGSPRGTFDKLSRKGKQKNVDAYVKRTIEKAIKVTKNVYEKPNKGFELITIEDSKGNKRIALNTENVCRIMRNHPEFKGRIRYDQFKAKRQIEDNGVFREIEDSDAINIQTRISVLFPQMWQISKNMVFDAMMKVSTENQTDSAREYVSSLVWDKKNRLDTWLQNVYGVQDNVYHRSVGSNWFKGLVKRIVQPGCKFDYVLVIEGPQGAKKSTSFMELGGQDWHAEITGSTDNKDFFMQFAGKAIIEFSEGEVLYRTDVKRMKSIITNQVDRYRTPFERATKDYPRRCVFVMTTNDTEYLRDETGNRRWLPVHTQREEANIEWIKENRDQLFAEAYHRVVTLNETTWEFPKEETFKEQQKRVVKSANEEIIIDWYFNVLTESEREVGITVSQVFQKALNNFGSAKSMTKAQEMEISRVLKDSMGLEQDRVRVEGMQVRRWFLRKELSPLQLEQVKTPDDGF